MAGWLGGSMAALSFLHHGLQRNESGPDTLNSKHFKWATKAREVPSEGHEITSAYFCPWSETQELQSVLLPGYLSA